MLGSSSTAPSCNRMQFSQRCLSLLSGWRRCYDPSSLPQMSKINLLNIRQAASHPWCLSQQQGSTHGQGGGRRQGEHSSASSTSHPPPQPYKSTLCFIHSSGWGIIFLSLLILINPLQPEQILVKDGFLADFQPKELVKGVNVQFEGSV